MEHDRSAKIEIGGREFELILTTRATKEIAGRYGGLENLGQKLMRSENFEMALDELVWLITLLANQSVLIHKRIYFRHCSTAFSGSPGKRSDLYHIAPIHKRKFTFKHLERYFHATGSYHTAERLRTVGAVEAARFKICHNSVKRCHYHGMFKFIFCQLVCGTALGITTLHLCQLNYIFRYSLHTVGSVSLTYQYILHLQFRLA